jgi:hypothetical protein
MLALSSNRFINIGMSIFERRGSKDNTYDQSTRLIEGISPGENRAAKEYSLK